MKPTNLLYLTHMQQLNGPAEIISVEVGPEKTTVYLDQTIFYPQGGGQPFDTGIIESADNKFIVDEVRFADGVVAHKGHFEHGDFSEHFPVMLHVDESRRWLNSRLHTAGHIIDRAVDALKLGWEPTKAFHFPEGPYVEYRGTTDAAQFAELQAKIQELCNHYIAENLPVSCSSKEVDGKQMRLVLVDTFAIPCGGTHVRSLADIQSMVVSKIKKKGDLIRVSYDVIR